MEASKLILVACVEFRYIYINKIMQGIREIWYTIIKACKIMKDPRITILLNLFASFFGFRPQIQNGSVLTSGLVSGNGIYKAFVY